MNGRQKNILMPWIILLVLINTCRISAQELDLIVTLTEDSIACKIDSISPERIFFQAWYNGSKINSSLEKKDVLEYELKTIDKNSINWIQGSINFKTKTKQGTIESTASKNSIYGTVGITSTNIHYEHLLLGPSNFHTRRYDIKTIWINAGFGEWSLPEDDRSILLMAGISCLTGLYNHHFEIDLGILSFYRKSAYEGALTGSNLFNEIKPSKSDYRELYPSVTLGYRFQKPEGPLIFRTGIGFPDVLSVSLGISF
jgi:hypothetical protein